jgi:hypothetical protein
MHSAQRPNATGWWHVLPGIRIAIPRCHPVQKIAGYLRLLAFFSLSANFLRDIGSTVE